MTFQSEFCGLIEITRFFSTFHKVIQISVVKAISRTLKIAFHLCNLII